MTLFTPEDLEGVNVDDISEEEINKAIEKLEAIPNEEYNELLNQLRGIITAATRRQQALRMAVFVARVGAGLAGIRLPSADDV